MGGLICAIALCVVLIGTPIALVSCEKKKAVDKTTIECIESPEICKDRYQYLKLGEKLRGAND